MATLPTELFHDIAEQVAARSYKRPAEVIVSLFNLRLTSRDVCTAVRDTFLKTLFSDRQYHYTTYALKNLVNISSHPILRKRLGRLLIHVASPQLWDLERFPPGPCGA